jgi:hypothetical protein
MANKSGEMDGISTDRDQAGRFTTGNRAQSEKHRRVALLMKQLAGDYDASTPAQKLMLRLAAQNLDAASCTRSAMTQERSTNTALRCLRSIPRRKKKQSAVPSLQELEAIGNGT